MWKVTRFCTRQNVACDRTFSDAKQKVKGCSGDLNGQRYAEWITFGQLSPMTQELRSEGREDVLVVEDRAPHTRARVLGRLDSIAESLLYGIPHTHPNLTLSQAFGSS